MTECTFSDSTLRFGRRSVRQPWRIKQVWDLGSAILVMLDPDAYLTDPAYRQEHRRGVGSLRNLRAFSREGELLWEAALPEDVDYYYAVTSLDPLTALAFSSHECEIDPATGRIVALRPLK